MPLDRSMHDGRNQPLPFGYSPGVLSWPLSVREIDPHFLIELLVVIAIIAVLIALLLPACKLRMSRTPYSMHEQHETNRVGGHELRVDKRRPAPGGCSSIDFFKSPTYYRQNFSSFVRTLPFTEQAGAYNSINFNWTYANIQNFGQSAASRCPPSSAPATSKITPNR